ncbi:MAG: hypothetical protein AW12_02028 [Candidatus Accumulibacter sp. BA-94]|nr:MAG: hypothetical protein AW12_02028 [Candidatus Accumulibacter sp. BA-94]
MPKRSNDFQRLIYLVRVNLADGAKVTESKMMRDRLTKRFREVDVVIEGVVGHQPVVVAIECRDHKRVADVSWIDMMKAKHDRLDTHALLLASRMGFTPEAKDVAMKYGIELFSMEDIETADIPAMLAPGGSLWIKSVSVTAEKVTARVAQLGNLADETVATSPDNLLYLQDETELCLLRELVDRLLKSPHAWDYLLIEAKEEHVWFEFVWEPPADNEGCPLYMKKIDPEAFRPVECLRVVGPCKVEIGRFGMRHGKIGGVKVAWGKSAIAGRDALAVATITLGGETKLSVNFSGPAQE